MKLYYHKTDGGAEYYCLQPIKGTDEGDLKTAVIRTDGGEIEILQNSLREQNVGCAIAQDHDMKIIIVRSK